MRVLAIILLTYFLIKYLFRIFAPILIKRFANKMQDRFQQQFNQQYQNQQSPSQKEGEVTIEKKHASIKTKSENIGEYVDFEELEE